MQLQRSELACLSPCSRRPRHGNTSRVHPRRWLCARTGFRLSYSPTPADVEVATFAAAPPKPHCRHHTQELLRAISDALGANAAALIDCAHRETALTFSRLTGKMSLSWANYVCSCQSSKRIMVDAAHRYGPGRTPSKGDIHSILWPLAGHCFRYQPLLTHLLAR